MKLTMKVSCFCVFILFFSTVSRATDNSRKFANKNGMKNDANDVCVVHEREKQMTKFNFNKISNQNLTDYEINTTHSEDSVIFQLCIPLRKGCNGQKDYSVCLKKHEKEIGIGKYPPKVVFDSFQISFNFTGEKCNEFADYTTLVIMQCDYKANANNSYPVVLPYDKEQCEIYIHWATSSACGNPTKSNCSVIDDTGYKYDLTKLTSFSTNYEVPVRNSSKILVNVCHSLIFGHGVSCKSSAASCLVNSDKLNESGQNLGELSKPPIIVKEGHLRLVYEEGGFCHHSDSESEMHFKTIIDFICDHTSEDSYPKYVNGSCSYFIEWRTPVVCKNSSQNHKLVTRTEESFDNSIKSVKNELLLIKSTGNNQVNCSLTTEKGKIDLTPLILKKDDYVVKSNDSEFHINVCSSLTSTANSEACQGKSVCKIHRDKSGRIDNKINLGNPGEHPIVFQDNRVVLHYKDGAPCPENNKASISTNITFECNYDARKSSPQFDKYTNCTYLFKWKTINVCESVVGNFYKNCTISNPLSRTIDLSVLQDQTFRTYYGNKTYSVNICGEKNLCNGSTICEGKNGLGSSTNVIYEYPKDSIKLEFTKGDKCLNGTYESDITFVCNSSVNIGQPTLISKSSESCHLQFEWQTRLVCTSESDNSTSPKIPVPPNDTKVVEKETELASSHGTLIVFSLTGLVIIVVIVLYLKDPTRRARCFRFVASPCSSSSSDRVKYCRINTTEEARLLIDNCEPTTVCQSDSDDDLLRA